MHKCVKRMNELWMNAFFAAATLPAHVHTYVCNSCLTIYRSDALTIQKFRSGSISWAASCLLA